MDGFAVTPESLTAAAASISAALGDGAVGRPPSLAGGAAYGHELLVAALGEFGTAVQVASTVLVQRAEAASSGLRAGARAYAQQERASAAGLTGAGAGSPPAEPAPLPPPAPEILAPAEPEDPADRLRHGRKLGQEKRREIRRESSWSTPNAHAHRGGR